MICPIFRGQQHVRLIPLGTHLVGVEGFMGAGKTTIAKAIASALAAPLISTDEFVSPREPGQMRRAYPDHVRQDDLAAAIEVTAQDAATVVLEGVCLGLITPRALWGGALIVYVARYSFIQPDTPRWVDDPDQEFEPRDPLHASVLAYIREHRPFGRAKIIVRVPD